MATQSTAEPLDLLALKAKTANKAPPVELTPPETPVRIEWLDPKNGALRLLEATSKVPVDQAHLGRARAAQRLGLPRDAFDPIDLARHAAMARIALQLVLPDQGAEWLSAALAIDEGLCFELEAALTEHERRYFRRDTGAGGEAPAAPRVALPALRPAAAAGAGG